MINIEKPFLELQEESNQSKCELNQEDNTMAENNRTLKELTTPDVEYQPAYIQYPQEATNFELRSGLIHLLPKFHGIPGEDPHKHLK